MHTVLKVTLILQNGTGETKAGVDNVGYTASTDDVDVRVAPTPVVIVSDSVSFSLLSVKKVGQVMCTSQVSLGFRF